MVNFWTIFLFFGHLTLCHFSCKCLRITIFASFLVIADAGGYSALFLGCSLLSIMEIIFYFVEKIVHVIKKSINSEEHEPKPPSLSVIEKNLIGENQKLKSEIIKLRDHEERLMKLEEKILSSSQEIVVVDIE